jgi:hypothetical protein
MPEGRAFHGAGKMEFSDLESIELYNTDGQIQSDLNEIGNAENTEFIDVNLRT